ncbi:MAG: DNA-binding domain-containing protein, partial [Alphaproteobacteria bacterium]
AEPVPYLADVARLEWARHVAYHAADAEALSLEALQTALGGVDQATLTLHPSLSIVRSAYPLVTIWQLALREGGDQLTRLPAEGEDTLVVRLKLAVEVRRLPEGGADFVLALQRGANLHDAAVAAMSAAPGIDLEANLAGLMESGVIVGIGEAAK